MNRLKQKWTNLPKGVKASLVFFLASILSKGVSYLTTPIFTRLLSTEEYGQVAVYFTWAQVFGIVTMFCLSYGVFNNGMIDYEKDRDRYSFSMLVLSNIITIACAVVMFSIFPFIGGALKIDLPLLILMFIVFLLEPAYSFWAARQRYEYKYKASFFASTSITLLAPIIAILCLWLIPGNKVYERIIGTEVTLAIFYLFFYVLLAVKSKGQIKTSYWKYAIKFNLPLIPHYLSAYLLSGADKIMISHMVSDTATALYTIAYSVASVVLVIWTSANSSLIPYTYEKCKEKDYKSISRVTLPILAVFGVVCLILIMLGPEVVALMADAEYREGIYAIPPIVGGVFFQAQYYLYANVLYYYKKPVWVMVGSIVAMCLNIGLNFWLIPKFGFIAAAYTTLICYFMQCVIDYVALRCFLKKDIYNMKFVGLLSLILIAISAFSNLLYDYLIVRYCLIAVIIIFGIVFHKKIMGMFMVLKKKPKQEASADLITNADNNDAKQKCVDSSVQKQNIVNKNETQSEEGE